MPDTELAAGTCEGVRAVATVIVGHHPIDGDAEALKIGDRLVQSGDRALFFLLGEDRGGGDAVMVVDRDMYELETDASPGGWLPLIAGDAVSYGIEPTEPFDVEMDEFAGRGAFVSRARGLRLERAEQTKTATLEDARDGRLGDADLSCDLRLCVALTAQAFDGSVCGRQSLAWR